MEGQTASSLKGKVAVVSGSTSGIGAAIALELASRGASVVVNYPFPSEKLKAESILRALHDLGSVSSIAVEADLASHEGPGKLTKAAVAAFQTIDILVNNTGVMIAVPLSDADSKQAELAWDRVVNLNARGTFFLTREVLKNLAPQGSRIINVSSSASRASGVGTSIYGGTKAMIEAYTRHWAKELPRKYGCTVNAVAPGPVGTETYWTTPQSILAAFQRDIDETPVAPRVATVEEVAWAVGMLCDEKAGWINGVSLPVNGGSTMV